MVLELGVEVGGVEVRRGFLSRGVLVRDDDEEEAEGRGRLELDAEAEAEALEEEGRGALLEEGLRAVVCCKINKCEPSKLWIDYRGMLDSQKKKDDWTSPARAFPSALCSSLPV